jgi:hypothetical protein
MCCKMSSHLFCRLSQKKKKVNYLCEKYSSCRRSSAGKYKQYDMVYYYTTLPPQS